MTEETWMSFDEILAILAAFEREGVEYVLVGAMGMAAQGLVRATRDLDFFIAPSAENVERLKRALKALFDDDPNVDEITAEDLCGGYPAVEYTPPHGRYSMDILTRLGEAYRFADLEWEEMTARGIRVRVATPRMLVRMKKGTVRAKDHQDADLIRRTFGIEEE